MKKIIFLFIFIPSLLFSQWVQQNAPQDMDMVLSIDFWNTNAGIAGGWKFSSMGEAAYTTNSGSNWYLAQVPDSSRSLVEVQLIDANTGYIAGAYNVFAGRIRSNKIGKALMNSRNAVLNYWELIGMTGSRDEDYRGLFLRSTDGGRTWSTYGSLPSNVYYLTGMKFINLNTGFVCASLNYYGNIKDAVLKTTNGGLNWNTLYTMDTCELADVWTVDGNTIFVCGTKWYFGNINKGLILRTSNGGNSWNVQLFSEVQHLYDINFPNSTTGFAVSGIGGLIDTSLNSTIYKTTNSGINWFKLSFQNPRTSYEAVEFVASTGKGIAVGYYFTPQYVNQGLLIARTTNYGLDWTNYSISDTAHFFYCTSIADANNWFVAGGIPAIIYKTTNGGAIGILPISSEIPNQFSLSQNYPNPFNPATKIKFDVSSDSRLRGNDNVSLKVYDILGREVAVLVNEQLSPGSYEITWDASACPSGVYFYRLTGGNASSPLSITKKMVLVK